MFSRARFAFDLLLISESPAWPVMQGRKNKANDVLKRSRESRYHTEMKLFRFELCVSEMLEPRMNTLFVCI